MADQSMKNTNLEPHEGSAGNANPHTHIEKVDIEKERQPDLPQKLPADVPEQNEKQEAQSS